VSHPYNTITHLENITYEDETLLCFPIMNKIAGQSDLGFSTFFGHLQKFLKYSGKRFQYFTIPETVKILQLAK
jgi:hypothetical protein